MSSVFIIAEAGVNHNGDPQLARRLIDAAKAAGADAVKFQTFRAESLVTGTAEQAQYQIENLGKADGQYTMLKRLELAPDIFRDLQAYAAGHGILFLSTPFDPASATFLVHDLQVPLIKIPSGEAVNLPFLRMLAGFHRPMILSTGMCTLEEVAIAVSVIRDVTNASLTLLHCTTNYPCPYADVHLRAMTTLREQFHLPVGYSDHTEGITVPIAAVAMGAVVVEKHFTLDRNMEGPDHRCSLEPDELRAMVTAIRRVELALGSSEKKPVAAEGAIKAVVRKSLVAARDLRAGERLVAADIAIKRPGHGIQPGAFERVVGQILRVDKRCDDVLEWADVDIHESSS